MTTGSDLRSMLPSMASSHAPFVLALGANGRDNQPPMFKKHKVLPHPRKEDLHRSDSWVHGSETEARPSRHGNPHTSASYRPQQPRRVGRAPEPPPTPPAQSRTPSAGHAVGSSSPNYTTSTARSADNAESRPPATPPSQQTPPTPNLTPDRPPPGAATRENRPRPPVNDRMSSRFTTDSRTESFRTARENPYSSDDDDGRSTLRPILPSTRTTSQSTVRRVNGEAKGQFQPVGLGLGLESSNREDDVLPRTAREFNAFDGEWGENDGSNEGQEEWDRVRFRNVTVRKRRPTTSRAAVNQEVIEDSNGKPTNATKAARSMAVQESPVLYPSRRVVSDQLPSRSTVSTSESSSSTDPKRSSIMSTRSTASTVVEVILVETAPQRRKTLRHVRKQSALRESSTELPAASSAPVSASAPVADDPDRRQLPDPKTHNDTRDTTRESHASAATFNSISSRKARREVWKSGGVPVVVVPERRSSIKSNSREPSLRSTSSRGSRSVSSARVSQNFKGKEYAPHFERPVRRRSRAYSESDGSRPGDQRTMDFPPVIPPRSSSLSAPTSRNPSRTGSLTAESLRAHNMFQAQQTHHILQNASRELDKLHGRTQRPANHDGPHNQGRAEPPHTEIQDSEAECHQPPVSAMHAFRSERDEASKGHAARPDSEPGRHEEHNYGPGIDRYDDPFGKRLSVQNTPFSVASVETNATSHAEVSEAMAVNIYPHQSKSVVLVDHSAKPSESSTLEQYKPSVPEQAAVRVTDADGGIPVTPPQQFSMDDVDSPLRNPRAPPQPPAINFIPATPSGLTPTTEKERQLGNYYEMTEEKPKRSLSLLRRTFSTRSRAAEDAPSRVRPAGFLTRTLSLSRNVRRRGDWMDDERDRRPRLKRHSTADDMPTDESRLHPFWRPAYLEGEDSEEEEYDEDEGPDDRTYRYPPVDNRPPRYTMRSAPPRRSLSARLKRTFAILPARDDRDHHHHYYPDFDRDHYPATGGETERRTIRRTPSGNLRVMKLRRSMESLRRAPPQGDVTGVRPCTAPEQRSGAAGGGEGRRYVRLWRSLSGRGRSRSRARGTRVGVGVGSGVGSGHSESGSGRVGGVGAIGIGSGAVDGGNGGAVGGEGGNNGGGGSGGFLPALGDRINITRRLSERRREKRTQELRGMISGPREVRDGVGDVIRRKTRENGAGPVGGRGGGHAQQKQQHQQHQQHQQQQYHREQQQ
ncbi:hypothetical protein VTK26DRAFT_9161 [Humicola hyalothermophila]